MISISRSCLAKKRQFGHIGERGTDECDSLLDRSVRESHSSVSRLSERRPTRTEKGMNVASCTTECAERRADGGGLLRLRVADGGRGGLTRCTRWRRPGRGRQPKSLHPPQTADSPGASG